MAWRRRIGWAYAGALAPLITALVIHLRKPAEEPLAKPGALDCPAPPTLELPAGAADPPVLLWATAPARLKLDGAAAFSAPESPRRITVGEHRLQIEANGAQPLVTTIRVRPFVPALLHAELDPAAGLTLVRVGAECSSCAPPHQAVDLSPRQPAAGRDAFTRAAAALRVDDWRLAAEALRGIPSPTRASALYRRLASGVWLGALDTTRSRALAIQSASPHSDLARLFERLEELETAERSRQHQTYLARWNEVTERFSQVVALAGETVPGASAAASARLEQLSGGFAHARQRGDGLREEQMLLAGHEVLRALVAQVRSTNPKDCAFQEQISLIVAR